MRSPQEELVALYSRSAAAIDEALADMVAGQVGADRDRHERGLERFANVIRATQVYSDLLGRYRVWREHDAAVSHGQYADAPVAQMGWAEIPPVPHVPFEEAYRDLLTREPRLATSADEVAAAYNEGHGFALARSASLTLTERIQQYLLDAKREGKSPPEAVQAIADLGDFTRAYSRTVYRTNLATAYSAGRRAQAAEPAVREMLPAFRFTTARDRDVRAGRPQDNGENHAAMEGYLAPTDHPVWDEWSSPLGFSCRCSQRLVSHQELNRIDPTGRWRMPPDPAALGASKHPQFGRRGR